MIRIVIVASAVLGLVFSSTANAEKPNERQIRIIGGQVSSENAWPSMVALVAGGKAAPDGFFCGGSLIAERWVLTAAHCVIAGEDIDVIIGPHSLKDADHQGQRIKVSAVVRHPDYGDDHDIALLQLPTSSSRERISLVDRTFMQQIATGSESTVAGWGNRSPSSSDFPDELHEVVIPIVDAAICQAAYDNDGISITENMICAGPQEGGRDSCNGDSGGPLMVNSDNVWRQIGIVSFGGSEGCAAAGNYGVYTSVATHRDWIESVIRGVVVTPFHSLGPVPINSKRQQTVTITNHNVTTPATVSNARFEGTNAASFSVANNGCDGATLQTNQTCTIVIEFDAVNAGPMKAQLIVNTQLVSAAVIEGRSALESVVLATTNLASELDNSRLSFFAGGDAAWVAETSTSAEGGSSARSDQLVDMQSAYLMSTLSGPGELRFQWKVSSEEDYDYLDYYIDGVRQDSISGELDWNEVTKTIDSGEHVIYWQYTKDQSESVGSDSGFVDAVAFESTGGGTGGGNNDVGATGGSSGGGSTYPVALAVLSLLCIARCQRRIRSTGVLEQ